jgi:hypothetical protein
MSVSTFVRRSLREPGYALRRALWGGHQLLSERAITLQTTHGKMSFNSRNWVIGRELCLNRQFGLGAKEPALRILEHMPVPARTSST